MIELFDLRTFVRVADVMSISAAARSLDQPKSSVSRALARLESETRKTLIDRTTNPLRLTDAGSILYRYAVNLLRDADAAQAALDGLSEAPRGTLRISATHTFASKIIAPMLPSFMFNYPEVRIVIDTDNHPVDLRSEDVNLAIRLGVGTLPDSDLVAQQIGTMELWICSSPTYLAHRGTPTSIEQLLDHELISRVDQVHQWRFFRGDRLVREIDVTPGTVVPEPSVMMSVLKGGLGIGRLADYMARIGMANGTITRILPDFHCGIVSVFAVYTNRRVLPTRARVFIEALAEHMRQQKSEPASDAPRFDNTDDTLPLSCVAPSN